ncbi:protein sprint isoform X5 [Tenebrio molitor]|uniref:protein sprint isoform X5 n=1 Tax=Tenebrio molitor TaxID=7067 RepID=UPI0036249412
MLAHVQVCCPAWPPTWTTCSASCARRRRPRTTAFPTASCTLGKSPPNKSTSDAFLEPYLLGDRQSPMVGAPSPSPPPCRNARNSSPAPPSRSASGESLLSSNGGSEGGSEDSGESGYGATCDIGLTERLIRSHPIWFLPGIQRAGAFHLLQGKEEGCFVVRQSSQSDTMALSVRLPIDKGPYIEHYLIQSTEGHLGLETSENRFGSIPELIAHYANCCDELPVQLTLPKAIREAKSRQQLSSLALLGQEFWRYSPPPSAATSPDADLVLNLNPLMTTFKTAEPSTPIPKENSRPARPNTLNLMSFIEPNKVELSKPKNESASKTPPPPPPRWSKPSTPQNNFTVTTTVTFSVNAQGTDEQQGSEVEVVRCDPKRMSPEGQCNSTISSKGSSRRGGPTDQVLSPNGSILSPNSDLNSLLSPDTLSPLSASKTSRHSKRSKHKLSKHYQESDIVDSPTFYYRSGLGDKISDYEDVWTNEPTTNKPKSLASPDLLQHTANVVSLNNNVLSPVESHRSDCSTPVQNCKNQLLQSPLIEDMASPHAPKQGSPFYAEPADSIANPVPRRPLPRTMIPMQQRHSNPPGLLSHSPLSPGLERIDSDFNGMSSSADNLSPKQRLPALRKPEAKPVQPPSIKTRGNDSWQVDNGWTFRSSECDVTMESSDPEYDSDWPVIPTLMSSSPQPYTPDPEDRTTVQDMISKRFPDIRTSAELTIDEELCRMSAYDNVDDRRVPRAPPSEISELTEFSDPWTELNQGVAETDDSVSERIDHGTKVMNRSKSFKDRLDPLLSAPRLQALRNRERSGPKAVGAAIRTYALELAQDKNTTFAQNIDNFIACTCESKETNPQIIMRNMRQFMSGMKNYLVKHGEKGFYKEIERERSKLKPTEFLNLDAILEGVMHKLVVKPLKGHLQKLFLDHYTKTGAIRLLADNIQFAATRPIAELAIKPKITLPSDSSLGTISQYLQRLQTADSPLEKLEYLLAAIATIFNSVKTGQLTGSGKAAQLGADDFLPLFVWVLVRTNFVAAEIEAEYMWGLLHPSLLSGEGGYYLTTLSSAVHVLKNFKESCVENVKSNNAKNDVSGRESVVCASWTSVRFQSVLKVVVPDELHGSILTKTLPAKPHMTTKDVCNIIAHKARITNPQDYALYRVTDGEETLLLDNECPQDFISGSKHTMLAYKRTDAKIAWPNQDKLNL